MNIEKTVAILMAEEGFRSKAYRCPAGKWTVGYGHNLEAHGYSPQEAATVTWTQAQAETALREDIATANASLLRRWPWVSKLDDVRHFVMLSLAFALGEAGLAKWSNTLASMQIGSFWNAAKNLEASLWAKQLRSYAPNSKQPTRVDRLAGMLRTGEWPTMVNGVVIK